MYDQILVPTDGSAEGERAVEHAIELASDHGATIVAVYVVNSAGYGSLPMETAWEGVSDILWEEGENAVSRITELAEDVPVETVVLEGAPSEEIVDVATSRDCDLIVMGTHGRGGINRLLLGSVTEKVVRTAPVPVLTVQVGEDISERPTDQQVAVE